MSNSRKSTLSVGTQRHLAREQGGVLVELTLVLGALLFIFGAVLSVGRLLNQLSWLSQTTYNVLLEGSSNPGSLILEDMRNRAGQLWDATHELVGSSEGMSYERNLSISNAGSVDGSMTFELHGELSTIFGQPYPVPLSITMQGPVLTGSLSGAGDLNEFEPSEVPYNCNGEPCGGAYPACPTAPCATCTWNGISFDCPCSGSDPDHQVC